MRNITSKTAQLRYLFTCFLAALITVGCEDPGMQNPDMLSTTRIIVHLDSVPADINSFKVNVSLDGTDSPKNPILFDKSLSEFYLDFPQPKNHGNTVIKINAYVNGCLSASGQGQTIIAGEPLIEIHVALSLLPSKLCTLNVIKHGGGRVIASPAGIDCGQTCSYDYPLGTTVSLTGSPDVGMNPPVWSNACSGTGPCMLTITAPATVNVDFAPRICSKDGWCWANPTPQGNDLTAIWIASDNTVYAVGSHGTILKWDRVSSRNC